MLLQPGRDTKGLRENVATLNDHIREYQRQLNKGQIQLAYKGILSFMTGLMTHLEASYPDYATSGLYSGYMDMTYFAFTPAALRNLKLKVAVVYLHEANKFELWLAANNRQMQAEWIERLSQKTTAPYTLSQGQPGVDAILSSIIVENPDFDDLAGLEKQITRETIDFAQNMIGLVGLGENG